MSPPPTPLPRLPWLDRLLPLWILLAMAGGLLLGRLVPALQTALGAVTVGGTSLPIALGLLLMMYPVLAKVRYGEMGHLGRDRRLLGLSLVLNWLLGPLLMFALAWCIAMVLIWNDLACGDRETGALLVAINSLF